MAAPQETQIVSLKEFISFVESALAGAKGPLWFRGVGRVGSELVPGLYRHPVEKDPANLFQMEQQILSRFRQRSVPYLERNIENDWEYLFLMQHFGVPTRLLDWTENPFIALFFALTSAHVLETRASGCCYGENSAIWVLDPVAWNRRALQHLSFAGGILSVQDEQHLKSYAPSNDFQLMNTDAATKQRILTSRKLEALSLWTRTSSEFMQIHQIFIRPESNTMIILYVDAAGRRNTITLDVTSDSAVQQIISKCAAKLPSDANNPAKTEVQGEISALEDRLSRLKQSIGVP